MKILMLILILLLTSCKITPHAGINNEWGLFDMQVGVELTHEF
jgi:hypothetical protein